jgi:hypothetical protein
VSSCPQASLSTYATRAVVAAKAHKQWGPGSGNDIELFGQIRHQMMPGAQLLRSDPQQLSSCSWINRKKGLITSGRPITGAFVTS